MLCFTLKNLTAVLVLCFLVTTYSVSQSSADMVFHANLDASQVVGGTSTETGSAFATFYLDPAEQNLSYTIQLFGLDLKPVPANRTGFSDVDKIHIHNAFAGSSGPHVLNVFGLPSEDDAEMVVDFDNESLTGIYNDADAIDPASGELFDQNNPLTTKLLSNFVDDLKDGSLYLAIHTAGQNGNIAIRGQLVAVPEPTSAALFVVVGLVCIGRRKKRS